jgi:hypothetical protein
MTIQKGDLVLPVAMHVELTIGEHKGFAGVKDAPDLLEATEVLCDLQDLGQSHQKSGGAASLENQLVGINEERGLAQKESIHAVVLYGIKDFTLDDG